jgi:hypothetical protein
MKKIFAMLALALGVVGHAQAEYIGYMQTTTRGVGFDGSQMVFSNFPCSTLGELSESDPGISKKVKQFLRESKGLGMSQLDPNGNAIAFGCYVRNGRIVTISWSDGTARVMQSSSITWAQ